MNSLFLSLSCLSLSPPKQQFFNCAIDEIRFPVCLASLPCSVCVCGPYRLPYQGYRPTVHPDDRERARVPRHVSSDSLNIVTIVCMLLLANAPLHVLVLFHSTSIYFQTCNYISYCMLWHCSM